MSRQTSVKNNLSGRDLKVFELHMRGMKNNDIAAVLGITPVTVSNCLNIAPILEARKQVFDNTITRLSSGVAVESAITIAKANAPRMMQLQVYLAEHAKSDAVKLQAISGILDRSLGKPMQRVVVDQMDNLIESMNNEELEQYQKDGTLPEWTDHDSGSGSVH